MWFYLLAFKTKYISVRICISGFRLLKSWGFMCCDSSIQSTTAVAVAVAVATVSTAFATASATAFTAIAATAATATATLHHFHHSPECDSFR
jgi:hypothetical protein